MRATTPFCRKMVDEAVTAVTVTLDNDARISGFTQALRTLDLDSNELFKHRGTIELTKRYADLRASAVQGEALLKQFKADAKAATDPEQRAGLKKFADALAGALYRQKLLAQKLGGYIAFLDSSQPLSDDDRAEMELNHDINYSNTAYRNTNNVFYALPDVPEQLSHSAKRAADEVDIMVQPINSDEDDAAKHIDTAFKGC